MLWVTISTPGSGGFGQLPPGGPPVLNLNEGFCHHTFGHHHRTIQSVECLQELLAGQLVFHPAVMDGKTSYALGARLSLAALCAALLGLSS